MTNFLIKLYIEPDYLSIEASILYLILHSLQILMISDFFFKHLPHDTNGMLATEIKIVSHIVLLAET